MSKYIAVTTVFFLQFLFSSMAMANQQTPTMKVVDRSWDFFKTISCSKLDNIKVYSDVEAALLERRRQVCLKEMNIFIPKPIDPY